jgi:hypothetical protein
MARFDDTKSIISQLPSVLAGLAAQYETHIVTSNDLRYLLKLDPTGISARQALKDQTGLDLKVANVIDILDSKVDTLKEQRAKYKDLIDLGLYHAALQMFKDDTYGRIPVKDYEKLDEDNRYHIDEKALLLTDNLFDLALQREDYKSLDDIVNVISRGLEGPKAIQVFDDMYPDGRNIGGKGLLWWLNNGTPNQIKYVIELIPQYLYANLNKFDDPTQQLIDYYSNIAQRLYELHFDKQGRKLVLFMHNQQMDTPFVLDKWFFSDEDGIDNFVELFSKAINDDVHFEMFTIIASDPQLKAKVVNILLEAGIDQNNIDRFLNY